MVPVLPRPRKGWMDVTAGTTRIRPRHGIGPGRKNLAASSWLRLLMHAFIRAELRARAMLGIPIGFLHDADDGHDDHDFVSVKP